MMRWTKKRVGAGVAVGFFLAGCLVAAWVIFSGTDRDAAHVAAFSPSSPAGSSSAAPDADGARHETSYAEVMCVDGIDVARVATRADAFQSMLGALRRYADRDSESAINTDQFDLASFAVGKTERELLDFGEWVMRDSPRVALQVFRHLLTTSVDAQVIRRAAGLFLDTGHWDEADREFGFSAYHMLHDLFADVDRPDAAVQREELLASLHAYRLVLDLEAPDDLFGLAAVIREHAMNDLDLTYADWFDSLGLLRSAPTEENVRLFFDIIGRIEERGAYGRFHVRKGIADWWLARGEEGVLEIMKMHEAWRVDRAELQSDRQQ